MAGEAETDAGAAFFGGVEWDENLFVVLLVDWYAVVADVDYYFVFGVDVGVDFYQMTLRLNRVFDEVDEDLRNLSLVGVNHNVGFQKCECAFCAAFFEVF